MSVCTFAASRNGSVGPADGRSKLRANWSVGSRSVAGGDGRLEGDLDVVVVLGGQGDGIAAGPQVDVGPNVGDA